MKHRIPWSALSAAVLLTGVAGAAPVDGRQVLTSTCAACHTPGADGKQPRISDIRKTPEGWDMTIARMQVWHGVQISAEERRALVKYLADTQGLAPSETAAFRQGLERRPNVADHPPNDNLAQMCARCHSFARVGLQRRDEGEWRKLVNTHLGQFPSIEYSLYGRDRDWFRIASTETAAELGKLFPLQTEAWTTWHAHAPIDPSGRWRIAGERPGSGRYSGVLTVQKAAAPDTYAARYEIEYADGRTLTGESQALVYTGYEWREQGRLGDDAIRSVYALSEDGNGLSGRWFVKDADERGGELHGTRIVDGRAGIVAVEPPFVRAGDTVEVTVAGFGLAGTPTLPAGVQLVGAAAGGPERLTLKLKVDAGAADGWHPLKLGAAEARLGVYHKIDRVQVEPAYAVARVGGDGPMPVVPAQFQAIAWLDGADGKPGTDDDVRLGSVPASWRHENHGEAAKDMQDAQFAGRFAEAGLFQPGPAGLNPQRRFHTNNTGDLTVTATVQDGAQTLEGQAQLMVTVQRWNNPPIK